MRPEKGTQVRALTSIRFPGIPAVIKDGSVWCKRGEYIGEVEGIRWLLETPADAARDWATIAQRLVRADRDGPMLEPLG
jgi:hypothetical protein